jgi:prepilin-type N-terminal cleavage/methylation domain-containing protein
MKKLQKGFTLVELLVVIAIIGVLATLVLLQLGSARARARDTKRITDVNQVRTAVEQYYEDNNGSYPAAIDAASLGKYLTKVPMDPLTGNAYGYASDLTGTKRLKFRVWTLLEQTAAALDSDSDLNTSTWSTANMPAGETDPTQDKALCPTDATKCVYDQGVQ